MTTKRCPEQCGGLELTEFQIEQMQKGCEVKKIELAVLKCIIMQDDQCRLRPEEKGQRYEIIPGDVVKIKQYQKNQKEPCAEKEMLLEGKLEEFIEGLKGLQDEMAVKLAPKQIYKCRKTVPKELAFQIRYLFTDKIEVKI